MHALDACARRWRALDHDARIALTGLAVMLAAAIAVRAWFTFSYRPALLGFPDSHAYLSAAALNIFRDSQHPAGYPFFLRLVRHLSDRLSFTILVQHVGGLATAVLLYVSVRRSGAPPWLGLIPAATVFFVGIGLLLEQALLADSLFAFLQALGIYAAVRALEAPAWRWPVLAGVMIGISFWVRTVAISSAVLVPVLLLFAAPGGRRRRVASAASAAAAVLAMVLFYVGAQAYFTGYFGYERQSAWNLYGRVATFVDCSDFTPPPGTRFLCPSQPPGERFSQNYYQYAAAAPAVQRYGGPARAPASADAVLQRFDVAAIEHEPLRYAAAVAGGLGSYFFPRAGEGYTPTELDAELSSAAGTRAIEPVLERFYRHSTSHASASAARALSSYERHTRIEGALLIVLLLCALVGTPLLGGRMRSAALLFTLTAICSAGLAVASNCYDARYAYPALGPLAAGAALGAWGLASALARRRTELAVRRP